MSEKECILSDLSWKLQFVFNVKQEKEFEKEFQISYLDVLQNGKVFRDWLAKKIRNLRNLNRKLKENPTTLLAYKEHQKKILDSFIFGI